MREFENIFTKKELRELEKMYKRNGVADFLLLLEDLLSEKTIFDFDDIAIFRKSRDLNELIQQLYELINFIDFCENSTVNYLKDNENLNNYFVLEIEKLIGELGINKGE